MTDYVRPSDIVSNYIYAIRNKYPMEIKVNDISSQISYIKPEKNDEELIAMSKNIVDVLNEAVKSGEIITSYADEKYLVEEMNLLIDLLLTVRNNIILDTEENTDGC